MAIEQWKNNSDVYKWRHIWLLYDSFIRCYCSMFLLPVTTKSSETNIIHHLYANEMLKAVLNFWRRLLLCSKLKTKSIIPINDETFAPQKAQRAVYLTTSESWSIVSAPGRRAYRRRPAPTFGSKPMGRSTTHKRSKHARPTCYSQESSPTLLWKNPTCWLPTLTIMSPIKPR